MNLETFRSPLIRPSDTLSPSGERDGVRGFRAFNAQISFRRILSQFAITAILN
jgi:hypothetical protein